MRVPRWASIGVIGVTACVPAELTLAPEDAAPVDAAHDATLADSAGEAGPRDGGTDGRPDAAPVDAPAEARPFDGGDAAYDAPKDAAPEGGLVYSCAGQDTLDCSSCPTAPLGCVLCLPEGGLYAVCVPFNTSCWAQYNPIDAGFCRCTVAADCIVPQQECNPYGGGVCVTCGENLTDGYTCEDGGTCKQGTGKCQ